MRGRSLLSRHLEYFATLYRVQNYSEAARVIPITYQGLKKAIKALEDELKVELFESKAEGTLTPTVYATKLFEMTLGWIHDTRNLEEAFSQLRTDGRQTIDMGVAIGIVDYLRHDVIGEFNECNPYLRLEIIEYADTIVENMLKDGDFDLAITVAPFADEFETISLGAFDLCVMVNKNHPLAKKEEISTRDLNDQNLMMPDQHFKTYNKMHEVIKERGIVPKSIEYCTNMIPPLLFALENRGLGMCVHFIGERLSAIDEIACVPILDGFRLEFGLTHRKGYVFSDAENTVASFLGDIVATRR